MNRNIRRLGGLILVILIVFSQLISCATPKKEQADTDNTSQVFAMGTVFTLRVYSENAKQVLADIEKELYRDESLISWRRAGSLAEKFNKEHRADMSEISEVLGDALLVSERSEGAFDMTVLPLSEVWNFDRISDEDYDPSEMEVPDANEILAAKENVDYTQLIYDEKSGILSTDNPNIQIELGAIGKGYAVKQALKILQASGASGGMISAGSSICVYGDKSDGSDFRIALRDPRGEADARLGVLNVSDTTISTSGDYERYFEKNGVRYHHILDPRTGYPAESNLMQATIICDDSVLGDALSTACFVLGLEKGMKLANEYGVIAILVDTDKNIWYNSSDVPNLFEFEGQDAGYILQEYNQARS